MSAPGSGSCPMAGNKPLAINELISPDLILKL